MSFPETRLTLVQRLASAGSEDDWRTFLGDYWSPVCRFALRRGAANLDDAEDVAAQTFQVLWENRLLARWTADHSARFRTLVCDVVRKILANSRRVQANRQRLARDFVDSLNDADETSDDVASIFYAAWAEALLQRAVESLAAEYFRQAKGDYVRVLYGRICQALGIAEVAALLEITPAAVDHYFRDAKARLAQELKDELRREVLRYAPPGRGQEDFDLEWSQLGEYLSQHGGLEQAVRRAYEQFDPVAARLRQGAGVSKTLARLTALGEPADDATPSVEEG